MDSSGFPAPRSMSDWIEFLTARGAVVVPVADGNAAGWRVLSFGRPEREYAAAYAGAVVCPLPEWSALSVSGADAGSFLHGQFTNDVAVLAVGAAQYNGYCSAKGRMLATFALRRAADREYLLVVPADIAAALERRLRMFVLRAKVVINSLAETHECIGIAGARASGIADRESVRVLALPGGRQLAICAAATAPSFWNEIAAAATPAGSAVWDRLAIDAGIPVITLATQDKFVPQMLNWEVVGGVSFQKGCYPGQEIVARMQYLGKLKERLYRAHTAAGPPPHPGSQLYGEQFGDQACGTVVNAAAASGGGADMLVVLQIASAVSDQIRLGPAADAPVLELLPLPYSVPATAPK